MWRAKIPIKIEIVLWYLRKDVILTKGNLSNTMRIRLLLLYLNVRAWEVKREERRCKESDAHKPKRGRG
jgi:hypothetical protein